MIYGLIVAGGMDLIEVGGIPKQFLKIRHRAIISYATEVFLNHDGINKVIVLVPKDWVEHTEQLFLQDFGERDKLIVTTAGKSRVGTVLNGIKYIKENLPFDDETMVISHEAIRPFVTGEIINRNINAMEEFDACTTVVAMRETVFESDDKKSISLMPKKAVLYRGQTPQAFRLMAFEELYGKLSEEERGGLRALIDVFLKNDKLVGFVQGEESNINISSAYQLEIADAMIANAKKRGVKGII